MRIALPGGKGFIGSVLREQLERRGHQAIVLNREDMKRGDRPEADMVVNLIRPDGIRSAIETSLVIRRWGLPVVQVSSSAVYGPGACYDGRLPCPRSRYGWAKLLQDLLLPDATLVRLPWVWGKPDGDGVVLDRWLHRARSGLALVVYGGSKRLDFIHVDDVVKALVWLVERGDPRRCIHFGTGEAVELRSLAQRIAHRYRVTLTETTNGVEPDSDFAQWCAPSPGFEEYFRSVWMML